MGKNIAKWLGTLVEMAGCMVLALIRIGMKLTPKGLFVSVAVIGVVAFLIVSCLRKDTQALMAKWMPENKVTVYEPLITQIRTTAKFVTASYFAETLEKREKPRALVANDRMVIKYRVTLKAGFDLSNFDETNIRSGEDGRIEIVLPKATILQTICNEQDKVILHNDENFSHRELMQMQNSAINRTKKEASEQLLAKATINGERQIRELLKVMGYDESKVVITFGASQ